MDEDDPELSCFCLVSPEDYHCQVISIIKSVSLSTFYVCASMQKVQLLIEASAGMTSWFAMTFLTQLSLSFGSLEEIHLLDLLLKSSWCTHLFGSLRH